MVLAVSCILSYKICISFNIPQFVGHVRRTREAFPTKTLIAGNVVTGEMVEELLLSGADIIKIGIGPGSVCTTRYVSSESCNRRELSLPTSTLSYELIINIIEQRCSLLVCRYTHYRKQTGVGYPQLSAILECADAAHGLSGHVISDGGCACPGDFSKAFGGGADFVMAGGGACDGVM